MSWIDDFMTVTDGIPSPDIYRRWSAITAISGALERRVWVRTGQGEVFPNLFTLLVGPPTSGKTQSISRVAPMWVGTKLLKVAPDNLTKASFVDAVSRSQQIILTKTDMSLYHTMLISCPEFGIFIPKHDLELLSVINHLYDNPPFYREERRSMEGKQISIEKPQLVILAGTQPDFLSTLLPEEAWGMGFTSRLVMVYAAKAPKIDLFDERINTNASLQNGLLDRLTTLSNSNLFGVFKWQQSAKVDLGQWYKDDMEPFPTHNRLQHYVGRRILVILKLCMIASVSRGDDMTVREEDLGLAKKWLLEAETLMPDIFRAMLSRNDAEIIRELHYFLWRQWAAIVPEKRTSISEEIVWTFLKDRVPGEKIEKLIEVAEKSGVIRHSAGSGWIPVPLNEHKLEG